jgi:FMN phosphatase YigB (HAD superfamily)
VAEPVAEPAAAGLAAELVLVLDFDGTVYRGDDPVRHYARRVADGLPAAGREALLASFERYLAEGVRAADACEDMVEAAALRESYDGWGAAVHLAQRVHGVTPPVIEKAFIDTRRYMAEHGCELEPVVEVIETVRSLRGRVRRVLATNSPLPGLAELLVRLGAVDVFDEMVGGLGKPDGLRRLLARTLGDPLGATPAARLREESWRLFSAGDHYRNDIEPAVEIGGAAGYIDRFGRADGPATAVAASAEGILPALLAWAEDPHSVPGTATQRPAASSSAHQAH